MDCSEEGPISFVNSPTDEDKAPFLTVESYDNRINLIDYMTILKKIDSQPSNVVSVDVCMYVCSLLLGNPNFKDPYLLEQVVYVITK